MAGFFFGGESVDFLEHYGIKNMKWGVRRFQNLDRSYTEEGKKRYGIYGENRKKKAQNDEESLASGRKGKDSSESGRGSKAEKGQTIFVSGSSKTQDESSPYHRKDLPEDIRRELDASMGRNEKFVVGDAPGIDRQVQDYLNEKNYGNVEIYGPGKEVRYTANKQWKTNPIDDPEHEPYSKEWLAKKDEFMTNVADKGLAVILDEGAKATRKNVERLVSQNKEVMVYMLDREHKDRWTSSDV